MYQIEPNVIYESEVVDGYYVFPFECGCGAEWTQTSILPCSHILSVCGSCGTEVDYSVVKRDIKGES